MRNYTLTTVILSFIAVLSLCQIAFAIEHPSDDQPINEAMLAITYGADSFKSSDLSINHITFSDSSAYPDVSELSHAEKYMLAGVTSTPWKAGVSLHPWSMDIYFLLSKFYQHDLSLPDKLSYDVIRQLPGEENRSDQQLDVYRNPLTGDWPVLDDHSGVAGSVYIHELTDEEKYHLAIRDENFKKVLYLDSFPSMEEPFREHRDPHGPPVYMRIIGLSGKPILEFVWTW